MSFLGITSDGNGEIKFLNWKQRQRVMTDNPEIDPDNPVFINNFFGFDNDEALHRNSYEYNPFTGKLIQNELNAKDDSTEVEEQIRRLDLQTVIKPFHFHPIVFPFSIPKTEVPTNEMIGLLKRWASIRELLLHYRDCSVARSVIYTLRSSIARPTVDYLLHSIINSNALKGEFKGAECYSAVDAIYAYISSFFCFKKWRKTNGESFVNPFQPCIDLWNMGVIPISNEKYWKLCSGENAEVIYEYGKGWNVGDKVILSYQFCRQLEHYSEIDRTLSGVWEITSIEPKTGEWIEVKYYNGITLCLHPWEIERANLCDICGHHRNECEAKNAVMCGCCVTECESSDTSL